jgi:hypothetical protein
MATASRTMNAKIKSYEIHIRKHKTQKDLILMPDCVYFSRAGITVKRNGNTASEKTAIFDGNSACVHQRLGTILLRSQKKLRGSTKVAETTKETAKIDGCEERSMRSEESSDPARTLPR